MVGAGGVAGKEADGVSDASGVEGPGVAGELTLGVEADSGEEHFGPLEAGEGTGGFEGGVGHAVDNTLFDAEGDVTGGPAVSGDIVEGSDGAGEGVSGGFTEDHVSDDLGSLLTGVGSGGVDGSLGHTVNDFETGHDADGLDIRVTDVLSIGVIVELVISGSTSEQSPLSSVSGISQGLYTENCARSLAPPSPDKVVSTLSGSKTSPI